MSLSEKTLKKILIAEIVIALIPVLYFACRIFVCDRFIINGHSMEPTLHNGQPVYVNKLLMGGRIYTKFDFDSDELHSFRMPGLRRIRTGDVAIYNYQYGREKGRIGFKINFVYAKRCIGCPGDVISIRNGHYINARTGWTGIPESEEIALSRMTDSMLIACKVFQTGAFAREKGNWNIKEFGPIQVPAKGMTIQLDSISKNHYCRVLEYETGLPIEEIDNGEYTFAGNYYFFAGDNVLNSRDSRYDGFVPEEYVIGIVSGANRKRRSSRHEAEPYSDASRLQASPLP